MPLCQDCAIIKLQRIQQEKSVWIPNRESRFYVNSWGREKKQIIAIRVGVKAPARILCMAEEDSVSEIAEVTHSKEDPFQGVGCIIASFNQTI